ncbi:mechanosensitive ion channel family protein [Terricaulis silvestris]|uniref:Putative MscS family protein YkuT n=1 Tax=Terricaulis silvestris TaxID=2686094 RepID=A0A6I6MHY2_9CAUL|nr:mechanosensitive ion channel domain-containing protein [Terricaulis silvestris]QGZ93281.1 putative MscS family protein YkuT [Terricaulis silvestris]
MIPNTATPTPASSESAGPTLAEQLQSFINGVLTLDPEQAAIRGGLSVLVFVGALLLMWGLHLVLKTLAERLAPPDPNAPPRKRVAIGRWSKRIARAAIFVTALIIVARVWGFDLETLTKGRVGDVLAIAGRILLIIVLSLAAIELSQLAIRQVFSRVASRAKNVRRASQVRTLAPVLSGVATTALVIAATMMALSEIGVEIGPLLAGAGIVGLAIGFGAQTVVKDFLTGIFLIIEDAVSVGDVVMIADFGGTVEEMSIRTIKLRDFDGTLHIFPYSEAQVIHNRTKSFSFAVFNLAVSHGADAIAALDLMKQTGDDLKAEDSFAPFILSPIEVVGVDQLTDAGVTLKARIKTAPGKQWMVQREYLRRIKLAFDAADIDLAAKQTVLVMPEPSTR